jgi:exodeoxyribonuclease V gamma subunit
MLHLHFSNRFDTLTHALLGQLARARADVFAADQLIVPSAAVRRALTLAIADDGGICANVRFDFLARWLWQQVGRVVPDVAAESPFVPTVLAWRLYSALGDAALVHAHLRLAGYLSRADDVMRFELAQRVAGLIDQYITYRPDWLDAWLQGRSALPASTAASALADEAWQAALWRRISTELGVSAQHPARRFIDTLQRLGQSGAMQAGLPACAHVFALSTMPPQHIELLKAIASVSEVHVYVLNPCEAYWFEVIDRRRLSYLAARGLADGHEEGNRLLAAWGRKTQSHIDGLVDAMGSGTTDDGDFVPHGGDTLLAHLQNTLLALAPLEPGSAAIADDDRSLEVHVCHSLTRELEVLQDHLLGLFAQAAARSQVLKPSSILVVTPDLEAAAPLIDAVFGTAPKDRHLPHTITGRARSSVNAPARALLALLSLAGSRFAASAVFGVLQQDIVARRFGLDDAALQQVHDWMLVSGMRWALDAEHRAKFDVPADARHTLADGMDRLFLGYALPSDVAEPFDGALPCGDAEGSSAVALGAFWRYTDALQHLHRSVGVAHTHAAWSVLLLGAIDTFMQALGTELDDQRELQDAVRELADSMRRGGIEQPVPLAVVRAALEQLLDDPARGGVPSGGITFSSMSSLHTVPFDVVCAIGLNDGAFPSTSRPSEFDLMAIAPQRGDRQRREDERNLFLDLLLSARHSLYLSHTGRSVRDNSPLPPSVLVSELLEVAVPAIADDPGSPDSLAQARRRLVVEHPLQPFSIEAFTAGGDERLRSFNRELAEALRLAAQEPLELPQSVELAAEDDRLGGDADDGDGEIDGDGDDDDASPEPQRPFFAVNAPLAAPGPEWREVSIAQLVEFFRNPCRYLLKHRLGIALQRDEDELQDDEPFVAEWPASTALAQRLLPRALQGSGAAELRELASASTELPGGAMGAQLLDRTLESMTSFAARVVAATAEPCLPAHHALIDLDLDGEAWCLSAGFADLRPSGLVRWRCDERRATDVLEAWLHHLSLCADPPAGVEPRTRWLAKFDELRFAAPADPRGLLRSLIGIYRDGLIAPVHFFPKAAWALKEPGGSPAKARSKWTASHHGGHGEETDTAYRLALRGLGDPLGEPFKTLADAVFGPLVAQLQAEGVAP